MKRGDSIYSDFGSQSGLFPDLKRNQFYRPADSPTSKAAVRLPKIRGEIAVMLRAVDQMVTGFTIKELARHSGLDYILLAKRASVLQKLGFITKSDKDDPNPEKRGTEMIWSRTPKDAVYL